MPGQIIREMEERAEVLPATEIPRCGFGSYKAMRRLPVGGLVSVTIQRLFRMNCSCLVDRADACGPPCEGCLAEMESLAEEDPVLASMPFEQRAWLARPCWRHHQTCSYPLCGRSGYVGAHGYQTATSDTPGDPYAADMPYQHVGNRYYDPTTDRFLQRDPIGFSGGLNVYAYVSNRPSIRVDPHGLWNVGDDGVVQSGDKMGRVDTKDAPWWAMLYPAAVCGSVIGLGASAVHATVDSVLRTIEFTIMFSHRSDGDDDGPDDDGPDDDGPPGQSIPFPEPAPAPAPPVRKAA